MNSILVVEDDIHVRELVTAILTSEGFSVVGAGNGREALGLLHENSYDLCVLDVMMPEMDGFEFCRILRKYYQFPVLMLTAKAGLGDKARGFGLGVDDYLTKPFESAELLMRIRALLRRYQISFSQILQVGALTVDKNKYAVVYQDKALEIPRKEFELLFLLAGYPGKTLTRDRLIEEVWGYDFEGNERTLDVHINRLRERFPKEQYRFQIITIRGLGYRMEVIGG